MSNQKCSMCGHEKFKRGRLKVLGSHNAVGLDTDMIGKGEEGKDLIAYYCENCGYVMMFLKRVLR